MCDLESQSEWREKIRVVGSYLDVESTKDQFRILNPTPLDCNTGYILEDTFGDRDLKRLPQRRLKFIYGYISSYCSILNSPEQFEQIRQSNKLASVLCDLDPDRMRGK